MNTDDEEHRPRKRSRVELAVKPVGTVGARLGEDVEYEYGLKMEGILDKMNLENDVHAKYSVGMFTTDDQLAEESNPHLVDCANTMQRNKVARHDDGSELHRH